MALLKKMGAEIGGARHGRQNREDRPDRDIGVDVRGPIERIDGDGERRILMQNLRLMHLFRKHGGDGRAAQRIDKKVVREYVELFLRVAIPVVTADGGTGLARKPAERHQIRHLDRGARDFANGRRHRRQSRLRADALSQDLVQILGAREFQHLQPTGVRGPFVPRKRPK